MAWSQRHWHQSLQVFESSWSAQHPCRSFSLENFTTISYTKQIALQYPYNILFLFHTSQMLHKLLIATNDRNTFTNQVIGNSARFFAFTLVRSSSLLPSIMMMITVYLKRRWWLEFLRDPLHRDNIPWAEAYSPSSASSSFVAALPPFDPPSLVRFRGEAPWRTQEKW